ncbi:MAG: chromosomal replication initiator protein DnaA [Patescibacteria group bacterium]|nr:chromosomal replication initiator protein DnaA [Patescibacteria group bacterium]
MEKDSLWKTTLEQLQVEITPAAYQTWFAKTCLETVNGNNFIIGCPSTYIKKRLEKKYKPQIEQALKSLTNKNPKVGFIIKKQQEKGKDSSSDNLGPLFQEQKKKEKQRKEKIKESGLSPQYTFSNFVVGNNNNLAYAVAQSIVQNPGTRYNPFFLYSDVGLGKTHLIQAIGNEILKTQRGKKVIYCTSEEFANQLIQAIQNRTTATFKTKFRSADVLLIDDIQFIAGRETTQEEFFHTFNALYMEQKQIVLTSDKAPKDIPELEDRLSSRFGSGMLADMQFPDFDIRLAILQKKCEDLKLKVNTDVLEYIAEATPSNIRELEGALNRVVTLAETQGVKPTRALAQKILGEPPQSKPPTADKIIKTVCNYYTLKPKDLKGKRRPIRIARPRQIAMYVMRKETELPFEEIGNQLGGRDHTTVMHGVTKIEELIHNDPGIKSQIMEITNQLSG